MNHKPQKAQRRMAFPASITAILASAMTAPHAAEQEGGDDSKAGEVRSFEARTIEEILVTAARRDQSAQDFAGALQVFAGEELDRLGTDGFQDYLLNTPGVSLRTQNGATRIALRGVSNITGGDFGSNASTSTVGIYLNELPIGGTSLLPDLSLYDLNRVEVLKGPQGTLYGDSSMGGTIKLEMNPASTEAFESKGDLSVSSTEDGGVNYRTRAAVNVPMGDRLAVRFAGSYREDSGYIDNLDPRSGGSDQNDSTAHSIRALLYAQVTANLSASLTVLNDVSDQDVPNEINPDLDDLQVSIAEERFANSDATLYGLTLKYDIGEVAQLTSVSGYYSMKIDRTFPGYLDTSLTLAGLDPDGFPDQFDSDTDMDITVQELRLVSTGDNRIDWVVGAFYRNKEHLLIINNRFRYAEDLPEINAATIAHGYTPYPSADGTGWTGDDLGDFYKQYAAYGEVELGVTDRLDLIVGVRWFHEETTFWNHQYESAGASQYDTGDEVFSDDASGIVPKLGFSYEATDDHLVYGSVSKGFRSPAPNLGYTNTGLGEQTAESDSLWNYEVGAKSQWMDGRAILNGSLYYIDWSDMQLPQQGISSVWEPGSIQTYLANGGDAEIYGVELQLLTRPDENLTLGGTAGYMHSELVKSATETLVEGARLPSSPAWTASAFGEYRIPAFNGEGYVRYDFQYSDDQSAIAISNTTTTNGDELASFAISDVRIGWESERWGAVLFVDNVTNERAQFGRAIVGSTGRSSGHNHYTISRPRTIGLMFNTRF